MAGRGGTHEQPVEAGKKGAETRASHHTEGEHAGMQGGSAEQHAKAGAQSHKSS